MRTYALENRGHLSRYEYLYRCLRDDIVTGELNAHDRLPSKRSFAEHLGVSIITVEHAYRQLLAEGYIYTCERSGYFVADLPDAYAELDMRRESFVESQTAISSAHTSSEAFLSEKFWEAHRNLTGEPAGRIPQGTQVWQRALRDTLMHTSTDEMFGPHPLQGSHRLRTAIARYLYEARGMEVAASNIVIAAGAPLLYTLIALLCRDYTQVALESPGYERIGEVYRFLGHEVDELSMTPEGVSLVDLRESDAEILHCMPSHQFPTGVVMSIATRYEILSWAAKDARRVIVEDDYDWEFRLEGRPIPALFSIDTLGSVVYVSTFSKSLFSSLRIAFAVIPDKWVDALTPALSCINPSVSALDQLTLARMLESGDYERHVRKLRKFARDGRDAFLSAWGQTPSHDCIRMSHTSSGLHMIGTLEENKNLTAFLKACEKRGIHLRRVYPNPQSHSFVIPLGVGTPEVMAQVARDMGDVLTGM